MSSIDLSQLPAPNVVLPLDFEAELARLQALVLADLPELAEVLALESEPINKVLQIVAYEHVNMQARINDAARACMLAYADGTDLDHLAALLAVQRLDGESDERLRRRAQMALEGETVAGSAASYVFHALSSSVQVKDAGVDSPTPGTVRVTVLSTEGDGTPGQDLIDGVQARLSADDVRPLSDTVLVVPASVVPYQVQATLSIYPGPAAGPLLLAAQEALARYITEHKQLGHDITLSGLYACLHQPGVQKVALASPLADIVIAPNQAAHCTGVQIALGATDV
jgi:phage-related baseplate assembly protein